ncbi:hypothetical protein VTJ49DRAFT_4039 [Mycothermus thermophilus]|uniref:AB hydrolase-1 domain-containing protein n=1 Tax=Humicola insolens TaxID=85995 RepID=A0ABR3V6V8_HUMIN
MASTLLPHARPKPHSIHEYAALTHPPHLSRLESSTHKPALVEPLSIDVDDPQGGFVPGFLHLPPDMLPAAGGEEPPLLPPHHHRTATILLSGAGGGVAGPSSIYLSLACKLATLGRGIPALRLDYRFPGASTAPCVRDARAAMTYLRDAYGLDRFVLVGWSFGSAVVLDAAAEDPKVVGCAVVAGQTAGCEGVAKLAPRPLLLLHGSADGTLAVGCSRRLEKMYKEGIGEDGGECKLHIFPEDGHTLEKNAEKAEEMLCEFIASCLLDGLGGRTRSLFVSDLKLISFLWGEDSWSDFVNNKVVEDEYQEDRRAVFAREGGA